MILQSQVLVVLQSRPQSELQFGTSPCKRVGLSNVTAPNKSVLMFWPVTHNAALLKTLTQPNLTSFCAILLHTWNTYHWTAVQFLVSSISLHLFHCSSSSAPLFAGWLVFRFSSSLLCICFGSCWVLYFPLLFCVCITGYRKGKA